MSVLDATLSQQLRGYLELLRRPIELIASLDDQHPQSAEMGQLLQEIAALSPQIRLRHDGQASRRPSFSVAAVGEPARIHFAAIPLGHEFTSLVLALLWTGGHPPKFSDEQLAQVRAIQPAPQGDWQIDTFVSLSCHNCPDVVQAFNLMAALNPHVQHTMIDGALFRDEVEQRQIMAVPMVFHGEQQLGSGRMTLDELIGKLDSDKAAREANAISQQAPFDVLVVGGGPAGSNAAIYAARKGIRTGIVAQRFGGQVLDTVAIENFLSVQETTGARLAADMESHVRQYGVEIMNGQNVQSLQPADAEGLLTLTLESGAVVRSRTVVLATGARWRKMNVPGELEYTGRGVAYCPHCDGPLFKGKKVAVIGGGNSGVEAAIDLAGIVEHVTLFEFDSKLRADQVLQDKLRSLPNATVLTSVLTTAVQGDGSKVTGLTYQDRSDQSSHDLALDGVFVQIGLLPNTEWLKGTLEISPRGEIAIDERCATSLPGVFAAGDATTVPYKQISIASGEGAKAALSAFDHLIRQQG